jgi:hypothetical protein
MNSSSIVRGARSCFSALFLVFVIAIAAFGQAGRGTISGLVTDPGGAVVSSADVALVSQATGVTQHTVTSSAGLYTFISLNPGVYQVVVTHEGFAKVQRDKINVSVDQVTEVNLSMQVGATSETVTVEDASINASRPPSEQPLK